MTNPKNFKPSSDDIAIVGMAINVPGAGSLEAYWDNLRGGVESITRLDEAALLAAGEAPEAIRREAYVPAAALLEGYDSFDAEFFGFSPKEAAILDPQHRKFLETAWQALENAGHTAAEFGGRVGVFAGCGMGSYFYFNICSNPDLVDDVGMFLLRHTGNDKDFLSTRVSHVFDLKGPSINLQTACSTSLVATHYAARALLAGDCDLALAGGVTIELPQGRGYLYKENEILSPDGHCHAFDHRAQGTVFGSGSGTVVLRRLADALADGDHIWAVIKGSAVNNDGAAKAGYLAPSLDGQAEAVGTALARAGVSADSIGYVECHGTGTYLGDPIEIAALTEAYRGGTERKQYCGVGSVKTNIGHLDTAAGVAGLVKTALALKAAELPPSLGYEAPNPVIDFAQSPFYVTDRLAPWPAGDTPRRAAVNALGVGGTNAHAILEEAPAQAASDESDFPFQVICVSARTKKALEANAAALAAHLRAHPEQPLADVAYTLKQGRKGFEKRRVLVATSHAEAADLLGSGDKYRVFSHEDLGSGADIAFMFPGGGAQYPDMARDLYETEPVFADWMDRGLDHLAPKIDHDLRALWLPEPEHRAAAADALKRPSVQLPLLMIIEYALAQLWISWGVKPGVLIGHSMGENTAAALAGVMSFEDCIDLVLLRGRLFDTVPAGGMLSVAASAETLAPLIGELDLAAANAPELCAVSGPDDKLDALARELAALEIETSRIAIDIAAHSRMLEPILAEFRAFLAGLTLSAPRLPIISNRSGALLTAAEATDPEYWVGQLRHTVRFADGIATLAARPDRVFLEVGPGKALSSLAQMNPAVGQARVLSSLRHPEQAMADDAYFFGVIGRLWACGIEADWRQFWGEARRNRVVLPGYQFQRARYFIEPGAARARPAARDLTRLDDISAWGYRPVWRPAYADNEVELGGGLGAAAAESWLVFADTEGLADALTARLSGAGHRVVRVLSGDSFAQLDDTTYSLAPEMGREGYDLLIATLAEAGQLPSRIAHLWSVTGAERFRPGSSFFHRNMEHGFWSLLHLGQALGNADLPGPVHLSVVTNGAAQVANEALRYPEKAALSGPAGVIPRELPGLTCATIDIELPEAPARRGRRGRRATERVPGREALALRLLEDLLAKPGNGVVAYRGDKRYEQGYRPVPLLPAMAPALRDGATYLITGGLGGIGLELARALRADHGANVVLVSRRALPPRESWERLLATAAPGDRLAEAVRAVQALDGLGGALMLASADVVNLEEMQAVVAEARARFGSVDGVIHAAGVVDDAPLMAREVAEVERVLAPKIDGLRVLDALFPDGSLELLVLFSSSSTAIRAAGQADYAAANEYLNAYAKARQGGATRVVAVDWGVWAEVGMAAEAIARRAGAGAPAPVVALVQPLLDEATFDAEGNRLLRAGYEAGSRWLFDQHRTSAGVALMPGTGMLEIAAEALAAQGVAPPFEIRDLYFLRAFFAEDGVARQALVRLSQQGAGYGFELRSDAQAEGRAGTQLHAEARLAPLAGAGPAELDLAAIDARCPERAEAPEGGRLTTPQERHLRFGPQWHVLRATALGAAEGLARLSLETPAEAGLILHPGLMDLATGWAIGLAPGYSDDSLWVPLAYGAVRVWRPLPAELRSWVRLAEGGAPDMASFDITLCDPQGAVCVEIEGFQMTRLAAGAFAPAPLTAAEVEPATGQRAAAPLSPAEERLAWTVSQGIRPDEGVEALSRALALGLPQVLVSSLPLDGLIGQAESADEGPKALDQGFERPDLDSDYVAPETGIEKALAAAWAKLLGVSQVGVEDNFFDLGGHSLIAVRLCAQVNREFGTQFPISVLVEAPTIREWAGLIAARGGRAEGDDATPAETAAAAPRFSHLVPLQRAPAKGAAPFFLVAGMFGNVLNLRHLATLVGEDRAVYGLQAKGLVSDDEPHERIEQAAEAYIAELREVQPRGPYLLGGFSGGGITAFEMARQLEAAGEKVALLVLLDTPLPVRPGLTRADKARIKLAEFRRKGPRYLAEWVRNRLAWELEKRRNGAPRDDQAGRFHNRKIEAAFRAAVAAYRLHPWAGHMVLLRPRLDRHWKVGAGQWVSAEREYVFEDNGWTNWVADTHVIEVPGNHDSMVLVPNVGVLATRLRGEIDAALARPTPHPARAQAAE